jgi:hypothetical protein
VIMLCAAPGGGRAGRMGRVVRTWPDGRGLGRGHRSRALACSEEPVDCVIGTNGRYPTSQTGWAPRHGAGHSFFWTAYGSGLQDRSQSPLCLCLLLAAISNV